MPTNNQPGSSQHNNDGQVVNDEGKWTVVKRKKSHDTAHVPKRLLKLRAPQHVWENMSSRSPLSPVIRVHEVDDAAVSTPEKLKSPSPIVNRLRPRLRQKK